MGWSGARWRSCTSPFACRIFVVDGRRVTANAAVFPFYQFSAVKKSAVRHSSTVRTSAVRHIIGTAKIEFSKKLIVCYFSLNSFLLYSKSEFGEK